LKSKKRYKISPAFSATRLIQSLLRTLNKSNFSIKL